MKSSDTVSPGGSRTFLFSASEIEDTSSPQLPLIKPSVVIKHANEKLNETKAFKPVSRHGIQAPRAKSSKPRMHANENFILAPRSSTPSMTNLQHRPSRMLRPTIPMQRVTGSEVEKLDPSELSSMLMQEKDMG